MVADKADAPLVPVRIDGAQFSTFSGMRGNVRLRAFPKVILTVLPPRRFAIEGEMSARQRRGIAGRRLYDEMSAMIFAALSEAGGWPAPLQRARERLDAAKGRVSGGRAAQPCAGSNGAESRPRWAAIASTHPA